MTQEEHTYKYFLIGSAPVRIIFNRDGLKIGAESYDVKKGGLAINNSLLSATETNPDATEISEAEFIKNLERLKAMKLG